MTMKRDRHDWELNPQADGVGSHGRTMTVLKALEGRCHAKEGEREREEMIKGITST